MSWGLYHEPYLFGNRKSILTIKTLGTRPPKNLLQGDDIGMSRDAFHHPLTQTLPSIRLLNHYFEYDCVGGIVRQYTAEADLKALIIQAVKQRQLSTVPCTVSRQRFFAQCVFMSIPCTVFASTFSRSSFSANRSLVHFIILSL